MTHYDTRYFQVFELVELRDLYYAGSHGMDIMFPVRDTGIADSSNCIKSTDKQVKTRIFLELPFDGTDRLWLLLHPLLL